MNDILDEVKEFINRSDRTVMQSSSDGTPLKPEPIPPALRKFMVTTPTLEKIEQLPKSERMGAIAQEIKAAQDLLPLFKKATPGPARAKALYRLLDEQHAKPDSALNTEPVSCRVGCNHCCYLAVSVSDDEADLLAGKVKSGEVEINMELLKLQASRSAEPHEWIGRPKEEGRCVFLGKLGSCMVYKDRPSVCRNYFVLSEPEMCDTSGGKAERVLRLLDNRSERLLAAGHSFQRTFGTLPQKLWERLTKK